MSATPDAVTERDLAEFTRVYSRPGGFAGAAGLYRSMLAEGEEIRRLVAGGRVAMPVLAVGGGTGAFTHTTMAQVAADVTEATVQGAGHLVALEAPAELAAILLAFYREPSSRMNLGTRPSL